MNPVTIKVAIVGLCTLMNVHNADTLFLPPPSLIIPKADGDKTHGGLEHPHIGFIAWDKSKINSTLQGATTNPIVDSGDNPTDYVYVTLEGDEIQISKLPADSNSQLDLTKYVDVATHSEYWDNIPPPRTYDSHYIPLGLNRGGTPDENYVAGHFSFGTEGSLISTHQTTQDWIFRNKQTGYTVKRKFMQEVDYSYTGNEDVSHHAIVVITLKDLAHTSSDRVIALTAIQPYTNLTFYMGNGTTHGMYYLVYGSDPGPDDQCPATHFRAIHMIAHTDNEDQWPIPEPETIGANCGKQRTDGNKNEANKNDGNNMSHNKSNLPHKNSGARGDSTGYCGPDSKP